MEKKFKVDIHAFQKISHIENAWSQNDYTSLLIMMEIEDGIESMSESDLKEMCMMSLNDFDADKAAKFVLTHVVDGELPDGKIDQISHDMVEGKLWEEFADPSFHKRFFDVYGLLREAFNGTFADPTGVKFQIKIHAQETDDFGVFEPTAEPALVRLLSAGIDENAILNRLYYEKIRGDHFPEAENILWQVDEIATSNKEAIYEIISSELWFGELQDVESFSASTHADRTREDEI